MTDFQSGNIVAGNIVENVNTTGVNLNSMWPYDFWSSAGPSYFEFCTRCPRQSYFPWQIKTVRNGFVLAIHGDEYVFETKEALLKKLEEEFKTVLH